VRSLASGFSRRRHRLYVQHPKWAWKRGRLAQETDRRSCRFALLYYAALFTHPEVLTTARDMSEENNGLPPVLINPRSATGSVGVPFSLSLDLRMRDSTRSIPGSPFKPLTCRRGWRLTPTTVLSRALAFATIKGTPSAPGSFQVKVTAQNQFGVSTPFFITLDVQ